MARSRTLTSYATLQADTRNAGGEWADEEVVTDQGLVTSHKPDELLAFNFRIIEEFTEGKHQERALST